MSSLDLNQFRSFRALRARKAELEEELSNVDTELRAAESTLLDAMAASGQSRVHVDGVTYSLRREVRARAKNGDTEYLASVLDELGLGAMVKPTVNAQTMSAYVREQIGEDRDPETLPEALRNALDLTIGYRIGTRSNK